MRQAAVRSLVGAMAGAAEAAVTRAGAAQRGLQLELEERSLECERLRRQARDTSRDLAPSSDRRLPKVASL